MTTVDEHAQWPDEGSLSIEELALRQGVPEVSSVEDLARPGLFESDEEHEAFLVDLYDSRRTGLA